MIKNIILIILIIISVYSLYYIISSLKKSKTSVEKVLWMVLLLIYYTPLIIYYLDRYNIPTKLKYIQNIDIDRWFNFISSYVTSLVATLLSGIILIFITKKELDVQKENNEKECLLNIEREKERKRIDYMPIVALRAIHDEDCAFDSVIQLNNGTNNSIIFRIDIENIGLGVLKNCYLKIKDSNSKTDIVINITEKEVIPVKSLVDKYLLLFNAKEYTELTTTIYYSDMFDNYYSQIVIINIRKTGIIDKGKEIIVIKTKTHDYKLLKNKPFFIAN